MSAWKVIFFGLLICTFCSDGQASFNKEQRSEYIQRGLEAFRGSSRQSLENLYQYVGLLDQTSCRSDFTGFAVSCLQDQAQKNCNSNRDSQERARCTVLSDVVVTNKLNENLFVTREERLEILKKTGGSDVSYGSHWSKILSGKYALLATELLLLMKRTCFDHEDSCQAREINDYCSEHSDIKNLPWQACVSAILWFVGTSK